MNTKPLYSKSNTQHSRFSCDISLLDESMYIYLKKNFLAAFLAMWELLLSSHSHWGTVVFWVTTSWAQTNQSVRMVKGMKQSCLTKHCDCLLGLEVAMKPAIVTLHPISLLISMKEVAIGSQVSIDDEMKNLTYTWLREQWTNIWQIYILSRDLLTS